VIGVQSRPELTEKTLEFVDPQERRRERLPGIASAGRDGRLTSAEVRAISGTALCFGSQIMLSVLAQSAVYNLPGI
jgi:hypothetical protein